MKTYFIILHFFVCNILIANIFPLSVHSSTAEIKIGSKKFTESVILGEIVTHLIKSTGEQPVYLRELGGTRVLWNALIKGGIDIYPEYTGTISEEILAGEGVHSEEEISQALTKHGIKMTKALGFNNTYAIGMKKQVAEELKIQKISDLRHYPNLKFGFGNEFMDRGDGWPALRKTYNLPQKNVRGLDHDLAYRGLAKGTIQAIDIYSTDAKIKYYDLRILEDDLNHFPLYNAVILYRSDLEERVPHVVAVLKKLESIIHESEMIKMNSRANLEMVPENQIATDFLLENLSLETESYEETGHCTQYSTSAGYRRHGDLRGALVPLDPLARRLRPPRAACCALGRGGQRLPDRSHHRGRGRAPLDFPAHGPIEHQSRFWLQSRHPHPQVVLREKMRL